MAKKSKRAKTNRIDIKKIGYSSAVFFGVFTIILYVLIGIMQLALKTRLAEVAGYEELAGLITPANALVITPITVGVISYGIAVLVILIYNIVAKRYPIGWELKK